VAAAGAAEDAVLVAASLGAFTAPLALAQLETVAVVLVNPMIPLPDETPAAWWRNTRAVEARQARAARVGYPTEFDPGTYLFHDVPPEVLASATAKGDQSTRPFEDPCHFTAWPATTTVISGEDDRFFPVDFQRDLARGRIGVEPVTVPGGHLLALSNPDGLAAAILAASGSR
jgi:pimeloyl-ACP methyl ester carboxylesterase